MDYMFYGATEFNQILCWDTSNATTRRMLTYSSGSVDDACKSSKAGRLPGDGIQGVVITGNYPYR